jgi:hypothetical protein
LLLSNAEGHKNKKKPRTKSQRKKGDNSALERTRAFT